ncbi:hypothetical protein ACPCTO_13835 [Streptomyces olivoreticuli]
MDGERSHWGTGATTTLWGSTGYRSGALVVDKGTDAMGVMHGPRDDGFLIRGVGDHHGEEWTAPMRRLRVATSAERRTLGLAPRSTV